jgi:hypothetical protein
MMQQNVMVVSERVPLMGSLRNGAQVRRHFLDWDNYVARLPIGEEKFQFYQTLDPLDLEMLQNRIADRLGGGFASESEEEDSLVSSASESEDSEAESTSKARSFTTSRGVLKEEVSDEGMSRIPFKSNVRKEKK